MLPVTDFSPTELAKNRDIVRPFEKCPRRAALLPNRIRRPPSSSWTRVDHRLSIHDAVAGIDANVIDRCHCEFKARMERVLDVGEGHIES